MKELIIFASFVLSTGITFAQWDDNTTGIIHTNDNVGIGITNPSEKLDIDGHLRVRGNGISRGHESKIRLHTGSIQGASGSGGANLSLIGPSNNYLHLNAESDFAFLGGNVGLGIYYPKTKLHVVGTSGVSGHTPTNVQGLFVETSGSARGHYVFQTASVGGGKSFSIENSGHVGIGSVSPKEILQVGRDIGNDVSPLTVHDGGHKALSWNGYWNDGWRKHNSNAAAAKLEFSPTGEFLIVDIAKKDGSTNTDWSKPELVLREGKVSIGTTTIPEGYTLSVEGKIICEEMTVQLKKDWGDFVFNNGYKLDPLSAIEAYIDENNHLPGIPSAKEIEESGIELGEMQRLQMIKIEELTLHLIQANKEKEKVYKDMESLKEKLAMLERAILTQKK
ncbi:hypothetical protein [Aquimarina longa]|uniref:hypothetical protein n=1 Tax=Aquimarina longa TaxID=1080221 RepID=UPI0007832B8B|nr:hypothetical protein [Aquimarina longa]